VPSIIPRIFNHRYEHVFLPELHIRSKYIWTVTKVNLGEWVVVFNALLTQFNILKVLFTANCLTDCNENKRYWKKQTSIQFNKPKRLSIQNIKSYSGLAHQCKLWRMQPYSQWKARRLRQSNMNRHKGSDPSVKIITSHCYLSLINSWHCQKTTVYTVIGVNHGRIRDASPKNLRWGWLYYHPPNMDG